MTALADLSTSSGPDDLITVDGLALRVRTSTRRKRFALTVEPDATLTLHAPSGCSASDAEQFVRAHRAWLLTKQQERERTRPLSPAKQLADGEVFRYLGRTYRLAVSGEEESAGGRVRLIAGRLVMGRETAADPRMGRAALVDWYCRAGRSWTVQRLQPWAARMGVAEPELDVRDLGDRWGSYRPPQGEPGGKGLMSLGWPLFQLPMHLIDYVIAHELAHVKVSGHRDDFWRLVKLGLPEYEDRRADLDEMGRRMWMGEIR
ncbi:MULTISPECIES: SprT family zinc-dependent metalloprotease [unclassified Streptomyces]|uniref:M48 family metallopeptidase n=1 Tax=unclassified Streptomyces TaxID=2593676 RepID=UPI002E124CF9|nr:M48 family metallopeptidase [Streptomyces sp. NBC_01197]WSS49303.1 M48 family metallopeptidase [Streptomyces sp. NBC_01180]